MLDAVIHRHGLREVSGEGSFTVRTTGSETALRAACAQVYGWVSPMASISPEE